MQQQSNNNAVGVALAWTVVMIPLLWGIYHTFLNVAKLFH
jgi:hypothetical protein